MNIFDIIGPVMIGPSSSHTAEAVRVGRVSMKILGQEPAKTDIGLAGSFAQTYLGHGTDRAIVAGLLVHQKV
jgi:L-serine dehydratase